MTRYNKLHVYTFHVSFLIHFNRASPSIGLYVPASVFDSPVKVADECALIISFLICFYAQMSRHARHTSHIDGRIITTTGYLGHVVLAIAMLRREMIDRSFLIAVTLAPEKNIYFNNERNYIGIFIMRSIL